MRIVGVLAIFVLSVCAIAEGAFLFRLSGRVSTLSSELALAHEASLHAAAEPEPVAAARPAPLPARAVPALRPAAAPPPAFSPPPPSTAAAATLRDALSTPEGRDQLRAAMDVIAEQRRQERLVKFVERREERDQRWKERIGKVALTGDEPQKINALFTSLQAGRRKLLEDMRAGVTTAEQTDTALEDLQESTQKNVRSLLGEDRWRKMREGERRGQQGGGQQQGEGQGTGRARQGRPQGTPPASTAAAQGG